MKINPFLSILTLALSALIAYALFYYCRSAELQWVITCAGGLCIFLTWGGTLAVNLKDGRRNVNFKVFSALSALVITALQVFFTLHPVAMPVYLLWSGILLIIWLLIAYLMAK